MQYTVSWEPDADDRLIELWILTSKRTRVTVAAHRIDQILAADPTVGKHVCEGLWSFRFAPLTVYYEVDSSKHTVSVTAVDLS
jgi:hypothetical protein